MLAWPALEHDWRSRAVSPRHLIDSAPRTGIHSLRGDARSDRRLVAVVLLTRQAVVDARERLGDRIPSVPLVESRALSAIVGCRVFLKLENLQFTGSFKERGALSKLLTLSAAERRRGVIAMSAGNHAQALAYHAGRAGVRATIVMPRFTASTKVERTTTHGAEVLLCGDDVASASRRAEELARERGLVWVHPYDDPAVVSGQGTVALEMIEIEPSLDALLVPVGGGGLAAGCALATDGTSVSVIGVQSELYPAATQRLRGEPVTCGGDTIADGIAVSEPGRLPLAVLRDRAVEMLVVREADIEAAVLLMLEVEKTVAEGAGAAGLAALLRYPERFAGRTVGLVVSGGNIDLAVLGAVIERGLASSSRRVRLRLEIPDHPGALAEVTQILGDAGANIVEVSHQRAFGQHALKAAEVELVVETRDSSHLDRVCGLLEEAGMPPRIPDRTTSGS